MSFSDRERSLADGQAISLYDFRLGPIRWTYTTANRDIEFNNMTFRARPVTVMMSALTWPVMRRPS